MRQFAVASATIVVSFLPVLQAQGSGNRTQPETLSRQMMYRLLFREVVMTEARADELKAKSRPDDRARSYYRTRLELPPAGDEKLKQIARACVDQMAVLDRRAAEIINNVKRRDMGAERSSPDAMVPPPPPELSELEAQRTELVLAAADSLEREFGPAQFRYFESLVRRHVGASFKAVSAETK